MGRGTDSIYTKPDNPTTTPGYWTELTANNEITVSGTATYEYPEKIVIENFTFQGDDREIEIRLADNRVEEAGLLVNVARLINIEHKNYDNAELVLHWPDHLTERDFNHLIIYDVDNREVLGKYKFLPLEE
ncbi:hypothetical protein AKJ58_00485 [candidate division MSBL1 archaeon SCGC-AAA385D11]|uniref:DM13 domain-containing protein n=1 Tax=candidate division MSBL1 archaeon SCGC-AAA385D11 TaxID=1698286 RepID=A0A133VPC1_9EURY|nr:hypothetical protein AKJ58_00485 [candidate division MSBL1 archaeon SCGC-AAA385D11]